MEHWLPLFYERLDTLFDYLPGAPVVVRPPREEAVGERLAQIVDYYDARARRAGERAQAGVAPYKPLPPDALYLTPRGMGRALAATARSRALTPFAVARERAAASSSIAAARRGPQLRRRARRRGTSTSSTPPCSHIRDAAGGTAGG